MTGAFMIALGALLVLIALSMVLSDKEPDGTRREGIATRRKSLNRRK